MTDDAGPDGLLDRDDAAFPPARRSPGHAHETLDLYRLLVRSVEDYAIFALDRGGHVLSWNPGAERFKGYTTEEILGQHFSVFYTAADRADGRPQRLLNAAARDGHVEDEGWRVRKDGTRFWANVVITALHDEDGELVGYAKVTRDLTARREAEEALRRSEERFRVLVQSVRDYGIFMLDPDGYVVSWNEGAERINGYTEQEILGRHFSTFYPPEDIEAGKPAWELRVAVAEGTVEDEGWRLRKDGERFWANVVITALHSHGGELIGFAKVTRDLTERRRSEERAIEDARRLALAEEASRAKSNFLAAMSHELRTPLNAIGGYAELMEMGIHGPVTDEQRLDLARIKRSQRHLLEVINDILSFSRIEAGRVTYDLAPVPLAPVLESVESMVLPQAMEKEITFSRDPVSPGAVALADRPKVEQILLNLVSNAVKFTARGGRIALASEVGPDSIRLAVRDTGTGIAPDQLEAIFEPFVQLDRSLSRPSEGTGLGLAISRNLARHMGGDLTVESTPGEGSTFTLTLPRAR